MSHTPRPWFVGNPGGGKIARYTVSGMDPSSGHVFVAAVGNGTTVPTSIARAHANARLIAAAPDLLEAAEAVVKEHVEFMARNGLPGFNFDTDWCRLLDSLGAAVRKARGAL